MDLDVFTAKTTFYVRETRTLALASVARRMGGPGSPVWAGGWSLGIGGHLLRPMDPESAHSALMTALITREDARVIGPDARAAWMRTWRSTA